MEREALLDEIFDDPNDPPGIIWLRNVGNIKFLRLTFPLLFLTLSVIYIVIAVLPADPVLGEIKFSVFCNGVAFFFVGICAERGLASNSLI